MSSCRLGGLGSGGFAIDGDGVLADWRGPDGPLPDPGLSLAIATRTPGRPAIPRQLLRPAVAGDAPPPAPCSVHDRFPAVAVDCRDPDLPLRVAITAWSPCLPMDAAASALPAAVLELRLDNPGRERVRIAIDVAMRSPPVRPHALQRADLCGLDAGAVVLATPAADAEADAAAGLLRLRTALPPGAGLTVPLWLAWGDAAADTLRTLELDHDRLRRRTLALRDAFDAATVDDAVRTAARTDLARLRDPTLRILPDGSLPPQGAPVAAIAAFFPYLDHGLRTAELRHGIAVRDPAAVATAIERCHAAWRMGGSLAWLRGAWPALHEVLRLAAAGRERSRAALLAGAELAEAMRDDEVARLCRAAAPPRPPAAGAPEGIARLWQAAGADHDAAAGSLRFAPHRNGRFAAPWSAQLAWGTVGIADRQAVLRTEHGRLWLRRLAVGWPDAPRLRARRGSEELAVASDGGAAVFAQPMVLEAGDELVLARA